MSRLRTIATVLGLLCLAVALSLVLPARAQSETGLLGHWKLDENGQGTVIADASPNERHGIFSVATAEYSVDVLPAVTEDWAIVENRGRGLSRNGK